MRLSPMRKTRTALALPPPAGFLSLGTADFEISTAVDVFQAAVADGRRGGRLNAGPRLSLEPRELVVRFSFDFILTSLSAMAFGCPVWSGRRHEEVVLAHTPAQVRRVPTNGSRSNP